ncbi:hypothetical protein ACWCP6_24945 [Streptomyces sp. NPDC002004]
MPQEAAGRAGSRMPGLVLLVGLALTLLAHVTACAMHMADGGHHRAGPVALSVRGTSGAPASGAVARAVGVAGEGQPGRGAGGEHPGHGEECCGPADCRAEPRSPAGALFLALLLLGLSPSWRRTGDPPVAAVPRGHPDTAAVPAPTGPRTLRMVCVSRT